MVSRKPESYWERLIDKERDQQKLLKKKSQASGNNLNESGTQQINE